METEDLPQIIPSVKDKGPKIVSFGGGHGLYAALRAFRLLTESLTAVVTVADDGGSSGRLRDELGGLPPGDLRMALAALCDDGNWGKTWRDVIQHRFDSDGELSGHSVGNLLISALWQIHGDHVAGLDWMAKLLRAHGRVLPMSSVPLTIEADVKFPGSFQVVRGQSVLASTR
ncbi:MAG: 2-phospho-L-lactate transferase CofD family protein, partial [Brevibacterium aurantiacum]|nr:2-phospho-L-lactate transferase CofD family protein [Brevibacterium aurantiacum]